MKNRLRVLATAVAILLGVVPLSTDLAATESADGPYYEKGIYRLTPADPNVPLIASIDVTEMVPELGQLTTGFEPYGGKEIWPGTRVRFKRDDVMLSVTLGVRSSVREVEEVTLDYLNSIAAVLDEGPVTDALVGDNCWVGLDQNHVEHVVFIRNNAVFIIGSHGWYDDLEALAMALDQAFLQGSRHVHMATPPQGSYLAKGSYRLMPSDPDVPLMSSVDLADMVGAHLEGFGLQLMRNMWPGPRVNCRRGEEAVHVTVAIRPTVTEVEELTLDYLNSIAAFHAEGPVSGATLGDNCWGLVQHGHVESVVFTRRNALFTVGGDGQHTDLLALAKALDEDIVRAPEYVHVGTPAAVGLATWGAVKARVSTP